MGGAETRFKMVEEALRQRVAELIESGLVRSMEAYPRGRPAYPRVYVLARRGSSEGRDIGGGTRMHRWVFDYVIQTLSTDFEKSYEEARKIHWLLYDSIIADPSLGITGFFVDAEPAVEFEVNHSVTEQGEFGSEWVQSVLVKAEA